MLGQVTPGLAMLGQDSAGYATCQFRQG